MRGLRFVARAACAMPHPEKVSRGGEDGFFMTKDGRVLGIADGVGGWADQGVNPAFFTWLFMKRCLHYATTTAGTPRQPLKDVLQNAWSDTVKAGLMGSCTSAVVAFDAPDNADTSSAPLSVALVGDCGVIVIRGEQVIMRTKERQYKFNFPHQIGCDGASSPNKLAATEQVSVKTGDVVILGTDGVFDNVFDDEILEQVKKATPTANDQRIDCQKLADSIARIASQHGADSRYVSPFSVAAAKAGYRYVGGKMDDVCVVAGLVGEGEASAAQPYDDVEAYFKWAKKPCASMPPLRGAGKL
jgi:protein phosphatase PTC7